MGTDGLAADPRYDFLSLFSAKDEDDSVPDSFFLSMNSVLLTQTLPLIANILTLINFVIFHQIKSQFFPLTFKAFLLNFWIFLSLWMNSLFLPM